MPHPIAFTLSYSGGDADGGEIDLYDVATALIGFQRSLALTTHLVLNGQIITQAPSLKGARLIATLPEPGSWEITTVIALVATGLYKMGTAPSDTVLGHLIRSAYDYVIKETLGFHVDFNQTLGKQYKDLEESESELPSLPQPKFDALIEKCEIPIRDMHRPIFGSESATEANVIAKVGRTETAFERSLNFDTYEYIHETRTSETSEIYEGRVSSYNSNTYKGRIFLKEEGRPVPFELRGTARNAESIAKIMESMTIYTQFQFNRAYVGGFISVEAFRNTSKSGQLKGILIIEIL